MSNIYQADNLSADIGEILCYWQGMKLADSRKYEAILLQGQKAWTGGK